MGVYQAENNDEMGPNPGRDENTGKAVRTRCREEPQGSPCVSRARADNYGLGRAAVATVYELKKDPSLSLL